MKTLVTGATGFLGGHLVRALLERGDSVRALGRSTERCAKLAEIGAEVVAADLRDSRAVAAACSGVDRVCHSGALSSPWGPRRDFEEINVGGTANVIAGCRAHGVRRLVYISSPSVLFDGRDQERLTEASPYPGRFVSVYSETKKRGEDLVNAAYGKPGGKLETVILRPKAIFGPGDTALLPRLLAAARRNRLPQIGSGRNRVDLTYVANVVDGTVAALESDAAVGNTYTLTNGESPLLWEVIRSALKSAGLSTDQKVVPVRAALCAAALMEAYAALTGREPLLTRYSVLILARTQTYDISAARRDLNYSPRVSIAEGLKLTLAGIDVP